MLETIKIENYRGINDLEIKDFKRINLLVGKNNSCKTSVLEAINLAFRPYAQDLINIYNARELPILLERHGFNKQDQLGWKDMGIWEYIHSSIFAVGQNKNTIITAGSNFSFELSRKILLKPSNYSEDYFSFGQDSFKNLSKLESKSFLESNHIYISSCDKIKDKECYFTTGFGNLSNITDYFTRDERAMSHQLSMINYPNRTIILYGSNVSKRNKFIQQNYEKLKQEGLENKLLEIMKKIDNSIIGFEFNNQGEIMVIKKDRVRHHLNLLGDGAVKIFAIICLVACCKNGILLIDEIENGIHYSIQREFWKAILSVTRDLNVQIFATTHSREMIEALNTAYQNKNNDNLRLFTLKKDGNSNLSVKFTSDMINAVVEMDQEPRDRGEK
jgi:AAA15 family ATPase/GTPase